MTKLSQLDTGEDFRRHIAGLESAIKQNRKYLDSFSRSIKHVRKCSTPEEYLILRAVKFWNRGPEWKEMAVKLFEFAEDVYRLRKGVGSDDH